jgi:hypothetical protein
MTDIPRDDRGLRGCAWCGEPIRNQPATGRLRDYCSRTHRELAYRARKQQAAIDAAVAAALAAAAAAPAGPVSTTDATVSSVVETPLPAAMWQEPPQAIGVGARVRLLERQSARFQVEGEPRGYDVPAGTVGVVLAVRAGEPTPYVVEWQTGTSVTKLRVEEHQLAEAGART